ncbi:3476_t:CDS:2, partial [Funneliformis mosseae]
NEDFDCLIEILKSIENEVNNEYHKQHLKSLQNINQGEKANIRNLSKDVRIEDDHIKEHIAGGIADILLQEIKLNALQRVSGGSENTLQKTGSRRDKSDLMFCAYLYQKWEKIIIFESGKWDTNEDKICHDHNKLVQLYLDGIKELVKKCTKETFYQNYIGFRVNIAGKYLEIYGLIMEKEVKYYLPVVKAKIPFDKESVKEIEEFVHVLLVLRNGIIVNLQSIVNSFQKRSRKMSSISPPSCKAGRLSKKNSANF